MATHLIKENDSNIGVTLAFYPRCTAKERPTSQQEPPAPSKFLRSDWFCKTTAQPYNPVAVPLTRVGIEARLALRARGHNASVALAGKFN